MKETTKSKFVKAILSGNKTFMKTNKGYQKIWFWKEDDWFINVLTENRGKPKEKSYWITKNDLSDRVEFLNKSLGYKYYLEE
jgi:hypothetical protein